MTLPEWKKIRDCLLHTIVLPLARKAAQSDSWVERFFAAESFCFLCENGDNIIVEKLMSDDNDLVSINAERAVILYANEDSIKMVVNTIAKKRRLSQSLYLSVFSDAPPIIRSYIENYLTNYTLEPYVRLACYRILLIYPPGPVHWWDINRDLQSPISELSIVALKFLSHAFSAKDAVPILEEKLNSKVWEIRMIALQGLKKFHAIETMDKVKALLRDPKWWVRFVAAETLNSFGKKGKQILAEQDVTVDRFAYDISQHVLSYKNHE